MASSSVVLLLLLSLSGAARAQLTVFDLRASDLPSGILGTTDGYVQVFCGPADLGATSVRNDNANPWWEEKFTYFMAQEKEMLRLEVYDSDYGFDDLLGVCQRSVQVGTHRHDCFLESGGTLHYAYTLEPASE